VAIGRTSATDRDPSTSDKFTFWLPNQVIVNPFDIVEVDQVNQRGQPASQTYGLVTMLEHRTDAPNHLANFISINPPIYDTQYWAYWSQPHGILKIATWLRSHHGYTDLRLLDCLA
jgi:hypothetical protein